MPNTKWTHQLVTVTTEYRSMRYWKKSVVHFVWRYGCRCWYNRNRSFMLRYSADETSANCSAWFWREIALAKSPASAYAAANVSKQSQRLQLLSSHACTAACTAVLPSRHCAAGQVAKNHATLFKNRGRCSVSIVSMFSSAFNQSAWALSNCF